MSRPVTLKEWQSHFYLVFGDRNDCFMRGVSKRCSYLAVAFRDLHDGVRKGVEKKELEALLARIVSRTFCIAQNWELDVSVAFARKYGAKECSYCQRMPCQCPERRPASQLLPEVAVAEMAEWPISKWANHLNTVYGEKNAKGGIEGILNRLISEVSELMALLFLAGKHPYDSPQAFKEAFALECADTLAWTLAASNFLAVDLQTALAVRYSEGCRKCKNLVCSCGPFDGHPYGEQPHYDNWR